MEILSEKIKFDFLGKAKFAFVFSALIIGASLYIWFQQGDAKYGVDYKGGHEIVAFVGKDVKSSQIRKALELNGIKAAVVQEFESGSGEFSVRLPGEFTAAKEFNEKVTTAVKSISSEAKLLSTNFIGPTIGAELRRNALIALVVGLIGILGYITYRFEFAFALGAVVALFHDVILCLGVYLLCGKSLNMGTLAAALTIVGYSVNDTIIVFDRIREEMIQRKDFVFEELVNFSINATLSRTVITSLLTLFSAIALLVFGGGAIQELALFLVVGVIAGTYSTIFIASPIALAWEKMATKNQ